MAGKLIFSEWAQSGWAYPMQIDSQHNGCKPPVTQRQDIGRQSSRSGENFNFNAHPLVGDYTKKRVSGNRKDFRLQLPRAEVFGVEF